MFCPLSACGHGAVSSRALLQTCKLPRPLKTIHVCLGHRALFPVQELGKHGARTPGLCSQNLVEQPGDEETPENETSVSQYVLRCTASKKEKRETEGNKKLVPKE